MNRVVQFCDQLLAFHPAEGHEINSNHDEQNRNDPKDIIHHLAIFKISEGHKQNGNHHTKSDHTEKPDKRPGKNQSAGFIELKDHGYVRTVPDQIRKPSFKGKTIKINAPWKN